MLFMPDYIILVLLKRLQEPYRVFLIRFLPHRLGGVYLIPNYE